MDEWPPLRAFHRQMYIDLVRGYLRQYGSQDKLARALGFSGAYLSLLLKPLGPSGRPRQRSSWDDALGWPAYDLAEALKDLKAPSPDRARQLTDRLCSEAEQREVLLYHFEQARRPLRPASPRAARLLPDQAHEVRVTLGHMHHAALHTVDPGHARSGYTAVWEAGRAVSGSVDRTRQPLDLAQILLILHDAACVLDHADLALGYARQAVLVLDAGQAANRRTGRRRRGDDFHVRLRVNAALAEMLALNHLGLAQEASGVADRARTLSGYLVEPESWHRSFLEQRLRSLRQLPRASIYDAEHTADRARELVPGNPVQLAGIETRLVDVYLAQQSPRSRRKARALVDGLLPVALHSADLSPLRRVQILRTAAQFHGSAGDRGLRDDLLLRCLELIDTAGLTHQRTQLERSLRTAATLA